MSAPMKKHPIKAVSIIIEGKDRSTYKVPQAKIAKILPLIKEYQVSESIAWEDLAADRISSYTKPALALRGARTKEGLTQTQLAKKLKVAQYNISKMENGSRPIGKAMAKRLAKILKIDFRVFL